MQLHHRRKIAALLAAAALALPVLAQSPNAGKTMRVILPVSAGSGVDTIMRAVGPALSKALDQPVVLENLPGAGGITGTLALVKAAPDGLTIAVVSNNHVINPSVYKKMPFDSLADITPIAVLGATPFVLVVNPAKLPVKDAKELVSLLKSRPGVYNYASSGNGTIYHLGGAMFIDEAGVDVRHIPYKGTGPMIADLIGGQVDMGIVAVPAIQGHLKSGALRAIGITGPKRVPGLVDVPTLAEQGYPEVDVAGWFAVVGPAKLPAAEVRRIHAAFVAALAAPEVRDAMERQGNVIQPTSPEAAVQYFRSEQDRYAKLVKKADIKLTERAANSTRHRTQMADLFDNPMGLMGFEFVEFASPTPNLLEPALETLGFARVANHRSKQVALYRQGEINFIVNSEPAGVAAYFAAEHGPSACGLAFRVSDAHVAYRRALELGAQPVEIPTGPMELRLPAIKGIGGAPLYLIDRFEDGKSIYDIDFHFIDGVDPHPRGHGLKLIDHLTHNVYRGRMAYWAKFYEHLFNFREIRYFDIKGEYTGLTSKAMTAPDGKIRIPLNEESSRGAGQIEEFLMQFNGEGIQHIALLCDDLVATVDRLAAAGVPLMAPPPPAYYRMLDQRIPNHGEDASRLQARGILLDGSAEGGRTRLLLQIFSQAIFGPVFFEFIQRKGDEGFGEGNFKALFESLERDQIERGVLKTA